MEGCVMTSGTGLTVPTMDASAAARTVLVAAPANRISAPFTTRCTSTRIAGTGSEASVTPGSAKGKLTVTVSLALPPNWLFRA